MTVSAADRQPQVDPISPVCAGAYHPPTVHATDGRGRCTACSGWYRILRSGSHAGDVGPHRPRKVVRRRVRETRDIASMIRRMIDAHGRRVADGDEQDLRDLVELRYHLDLTVAAAVEALHYEQGFSWGTLGEILGVTKQAMEKRFGR